MKYINIVQGIFLKRVNSFIAHVIIDQIEHVVHVKNTGRCRVFLPEISNPSLFNFVDRIGFKMIPVEKYRKLQTEEKGIRKVFS